MSDIRNLEPKAVWNNFYSLTQCPRPSKHESAARDFLANFGKKLGLETIEDEVGNIIIRKPATKGMEKKAGVILQGHFDMVPQANSDVKHDFTKDPIKAYVDGEWVTAEGTTLGADNGIGVAAGMSILESTDIAHGPLECLFTIDEETGMTGANGLKPKMLNGKYFLNLDSEDEGELYVGCAGGVDANISGTYKAKELPQNVVAYKLIAKGMKGGHSGMDINLGRANANKILFRFLYAVMQKMNIRIASVNGGSLRNAIPREAEAVVVVAAGKAKKFEKFVNKMLQIFKNEFSATEPTLEFMCEPTNLPKAVMPNDVQNRIVRAVYVCPNGVCRMSDAMPGLVETSNNIAIVTINEGEISVKCLIRSSVDSAKDAIADRVGASFELAGCKVEFTGGYPGWKPNTKSKILHIMQETYQKLYGKDPKITAVHAGLECGILGAVYPNWDMISFGPTIRHPHSPDEKVNIESVQKFFEFLKETLKNIPNK
ncbi:MAG: aminoacyl-histidine dipeptidase [Bacteroidales bacterium]|nr:aminoacyl-histidine dipeptidase [Bacteroidales bacterium]